VASIATGHPRLPLPDEEAAYVDGSKVFFATANQLAALRSASVLLGLSLPRSEIPVYELFWLASQRTAFIHGFKIYKPHTSIVRHGFCPGLEEGSTCPDRRP
jgi:hypothetical protein